MKQRLFWGLFALTLMVYGAIVGWSLPTVSKAAQGLTPFDMRPGGYSFAEALAFVSALSPAGAQFYLDVQQKLDMAYPVLIALTLFFAIAATLPERLGRWRWAAASIVWPITIFDYFENHAVAVMIKAGPRGLSPEMVAHASQWTILKSNATMGVGVVLLSLLTWRAARGTARLWRSKFSDTGATGHHWKR